MEQIHPAMMQVHTLKNRLFETTKRVQALDTQAMQAARIRQDRLTKPQGSLGQLEELSIRLAGMTGKVRPRFPRKAVMVLAADHGVAAEGVSAYSQAVTAQMLLNFLAGGASVIVRACQVGARVIVADLGVVSALPEYPCLLRRKMGYGTRS